MSSKYPDRDRLVVERRQYTDGNRYVTEYRPIGSDEPTQWEGRDMETPDGFLIEGVTAEGDEGILQAFDLYDGCFATVKKEKVSGLVFPTVGRGNGKKLR